MNVDDYHVLLGYHYWANERLLRQIDPLSNEQYTRDLGASFPSIQATVAHLIGAEAVWLGRFLGEAIEKPRPDQIPTVVIARERWSITEGKLRAFVQNLTDDDLGRVMTVDRGGGVVHQHTVGRLLHHLFNHGTYHRGQVASMLRQVGAEATSTDMYGYFIHH